VEEFWRAFLGGTVGAFAGVGGSFLVARWQASRPTAHERKLSETASAEQTHTAQWHAGIAVSRQMLADVEDMRKRLGHLNPRTNPGGRNRAADKTTPQQRQAAYDAHDRLRELNSSHAVELPDELGSRWYSMTQLVDEYVEAQRQLGEFWDEPRLKRARSDIRNYMAYVKRSLATYIKTGEEIERCEPPVLSREDMEVWTANGA